MQLRLCYEIIITITGPPRSILLSTSGKKALDNTALSKLPFFYHSLTLHWVCNYTVQNITLSYLWNCAIFCEHTAFPFFNPFLFIQWTLAVLHSRSPVEQYSGWCHYTIKTEKLLVFFVCFPLHVSDRHLCTHTSVLENQMAWCFRWLKPTVCGYYTNWWLVPLKAFLCKVNCKAHISRIGLVFILDACWIK